MDTNTVAQPAHPATRELRALELYRHHGDDIEHLSGETFLVPSSDGRTTYRVDYANETCSCPDAEFHPEANCKHVLAVGIYHAKHRIRPEVLSGDPFPYAAAASLAAALTADECVDCGVSVAGPDEGVVAQNGDVLCHGCTLPTY